VQGIYQPEPSTGGKEKIMLRKIGMSGIVVLSLLLWSGAARATQIEIYGAWHCGNDFCTWGTVRDMTNFDTNNHWMIDRGDGSPSVNLVILSFVNPLKLLNQTNDSQTANGVPIGMNSAIVSYFTSHNIRVMLSIGGITYTSDWDTALSTNPTQLGTYAAQVAERLGVGIEIDYENNTSPNLTALQSFINAYRAILPYDATGANPAARLTVDLAAGDQYLVPLAAKATADWLNTTNPVLDYANAMVPNKQPPSASAAESNWQQHISGYPRITPPVPPLAPAKMTSSLYIVTGKNPAPECTTFSSSLEDSTGTFVQSVAPAGAGTTPGLLGYMFWAAECQGTHSVCTTPPNTCQGGVGVGAQTYNVPFPMPALRQN
jgi:Glycosyl hydrolases family 18